jgi:methylthioribose-1-phosphate isomerase
MRTLEWNYQENHLEMIDQRLLPVELKMVELKTYQEVAIAITDMVVRGAPAIGASVGFGMALAAFYSKAIEKDELLCDLQTAADYLHNSRPTAVNLEWALKRIMSFYKKQTGSVEELKVQILKEAQRIADEDVEINKRMAENGAALIQPGETVIHHCNTGALATVDWGTALGVIRTAHEQGKNIKVLVDETRPRLQGSRLTAWELEQYGIPYHIISDNSAGYFLSKGEVQSVFVGADRVAANGDTANKIGTYMLALAAKDNNVPFYVVAPRSTIDFDIPSGDLIPIEERDEAEVLDIQRDGKRLSPKGAHARNPAFDLTPNHLITGIVTEYGVIEAPFDENLVKLKELRK